MKRTLLFLCACTAFLSVASAQQPMCKRDSSLLLKDSVFISPRPDSSINQAVYALGTACINKAYDKSVTIKVPPTFTFQGVTLQIISASIATTGAVANIPGGMFYVCDPPNCVFNANTLGCILLTGKPNNPAQAPDTLDLKISALITTTFFPVPIEFPGPIAPGNYYLPLYTESNCISHTDEVPGNISALRNVPNPFSGQTLIEVEALESDEALFEVFDLLGNRIYFQQVNLQAGSNQFTFDAGRMAAGTYFYTVGNEKGKLSGKMILGQ